MTQSAMSWYAPVPAHPGVQGWQPHLPRMARWLSAVLPVALLLGLVVGVAAIVPAPPVPTPVERHLPADGAVRWIGENAGDGVWQVTAARREAAVAHAMVSLRARTQLRELGLTARPAGRWLVVDALRPDVTGALVSFSYQLTGTGAALVAVEGSQSWSVFHPGLPMLDDRLLAGGTVHWQGGLSISGDRGMPAFTGPAEAEVRGEAVAGSPDCRRIVATIRTAGSSSETGTTWCAGSNPGWAGSSDGNGYGFDRPSGRPAIPTPDLTPAVDLAPSNGRAKQVRTFRGVGGVLLQYHAPTASQVLRLRDQVVLVDINGDLQVWGPLEAQDPQFSDYFLLWRGRPGSAVRAITQLGDLLVVGTTAGRLIAYTRTGWVLWEVDLDDAATNLRAWDDQLLVTDADGGVQLLDALTGRSRWTAERDNLVGQPTATTRGGRGFVGLQTPFGVEVVDLARDTSWTARVETRESQAGLTGGALVVRQGNWLVARDVATGEERWTRLVPPRTRMVFTATALVLHSPESVTGIGPDGTTLWSAPATGGVLVDAAGTVLVYGNGLLFRGANGSEQRWALRSDLRPPVTGSFAVTARGVLALHRDSEFATQWWEYS